MYFYSKESSEKVVHKDGCGYIKNIKDENLRTFKTVKEANKAGYRLCEHCDLAWRQYKKERKDVDMFCRKNAFFCRALFDLMIVVTPHSQWKILFGENGMRLYHSNTQKRKTDECSEIKGYHKQNVKCDSVIEYLDYILKHDRYRMKNPCNKKRHEPAKGTKAYRKEMKNKKQREKRYAIKRVLDIIDSLNGDVASSDKRRTCRI